MPPCVERRIEGDIGSLCLWIEGSTTEAERAKAKTVPPNVVAYNDQMHDIKLFMQLTWDTDYNNVANILIGPDSKLYKVDSSRAFRETETLRREDALMRFRRRTLSALESLTRERMDAALGPWLDERQLNGLWQRRVQDPRARPRAGGQPGRSGRPLRLNLISPGARRAGPTGTGSTEASSASRSPPRRRSGRPR